MAEIIPWHSDVVQRPVKFVRAKIRQQALLSIYADPPKSPDAWTTSTAYALESGRTFPNVHTGASGLTYTVLTQGLVCFGRARDSDVGCFLAAPDYRVVGSKDTFIAIKRGIIVINEETDEPELKWKEVGGGAGLIALTFAGQAFHAVYLKPQWGAARVETSFDGIHWDNKDNVFPEVDMGNIGGAVAFNGDPEKLQSGTYAMAGSVAIEVPDEDNFWFSEICNLAWATAPPPPPPPPESEPIKELSWSHGSIEGARENPGARSGTVFQRYGVENQQSTTAGGKDVFIAATFHKDVQVIDVNFPFEPPMDRTFILPNAAVASSSTGGHWTNHELAGTEDGYHVPGVDWIYGESTTQAVIFVRAKTPEDSYFICAANNNYGSSGEPDGSNWVTVHRSSDGITWEFMRSFGGKGSGSKNFCGALSAIDANLNSTTIITLGND